MREIGQITDINSEDRLVQQTFAEHLEKVLGWDSIYAWNHDGSDVASADAASIVTPNSDTPYSFVWVDLRAEPLVITVPQVDPQRYYSVMMVDNNTFNYAIIGTRATGNGAGNALNGGAGGVPVLHRLE